jgi:hypothetical protein
MRRETGPGFGQVPGVYALAGDAGGNLYVADWAQRIQKRDAQGNWSLLATQSAEALAVDGADNLYVAADDIRRRDAQGNCYENRIAGPVQAHGTPAAPRLTAATGR